MPVMVFYKDKRVSIVAAKDVCEALASVTKKLLDAVIEVRVVEPVHTYNANEVHIEVRFRDFGEYTVKQLEKYHSEAMKNIGEILKNHKVQCSYSFYIIPTATPRSMWSQSKT